MAISVGIMTPLILLGKHFGWSNAAFWWPFVVVLAVTTVMHLLMGDKEEQRRKVRGESERRHDAAK